MRSPKSDIAAPVDADSCVKFPRVYIFEIS